MAVTQSVSTGWSSIQWEDRKQGAMGLNDRDKNMMPAVTFHGHRPESSSIVPIKFVSLSLCADGASQYRVMPTNFGTTLDMIHKTFRIAKALKANSTCVGTTNISPPNGFDAMSLEAMQCKLLECGSIV